MTVQIRTVNAGRGWYWIAEGFALFRKSPLNWIALCLMLSGVFWLATKLQLIGILVLNLLYPVFLAGLMLGSRSLDRGERLPLTYLLAGFGTGTAALVALGGIALVAQIAISGLILSVGGAEFHAVVEASQGGFQEAIKVVSEMDSAALAKVQLASLLSLALNLPLFMAMWFAPLLVVFEGQPAGASLKNSVVACIRNILPFLVYGIMLTGLLFVALLPLALGLFLLVPTVFASIYAAYKDIFEISELPEPATAAPSA
jgi:hypothetical protein